MLRLDTGHHTLTCGACGAPLSRLKYLPKPAAPLKPAISHHPASQKLRNLPKAPAAPKPKPEKRRARRKGFLRKFFEEAADLVEDVTDIVEDIFD